MAINPTGSAGSSGIADIFGSPLQSGPSQPLIDAAHQTSDLDIAGTRSDPDASPNPVPMYAYGFEGQGDDLFSLNPTEKG